MLRKWAVRGQIDGNHTSSLQRCGTGRGAEERGGGGTGRRKEGGGEGREAGRQRVGGAAIARAPLRIERT